MKHFTWSSFVRYWKWGVWCVLRDTWYAKKEARWWALWRLYEFTRDMLRYGFTAGDVWNLHNTIGEFVLPRLEWFRENPTGHPLDLTYEQWKETLDKMLLAFRLQARDYEGEILTPEEWAQQQEGFELFGKYLGHLWD